MARNKGVSVGVEITGNAKGFKSAAEDAAKASAKLKDKATKDASGIGKAFTSMGGAVGNAARAVSNAFKLIVANPVGLAITAVVGALGALVSAFKSSDKGGTEFAARFEQVKSVIDVVRQRLISVGEAVTHVFKGEWKKAAESMKEAFKGIGDQIKEATKAAYEYTRAIDAIEDSENNYISKSAENRNKIARLEYIAQDRTKSTSERKSALQEAIRIGEQELAAVKKIAKDKLDAEIKYLAEKNNVHKDEVLAFIRMSDEEQSHASDALQNLRNNYEDKFTEIEKLYANVLDADTKFYEENKRNISRLTGFEQEEFNKRKNALKELKGFYEDVYRVAVKIPSFAKLGENKAPVKGGGLARGGKDLAGAPNVEVGSMVDELAIAEGLVGQLNSAFQGFFQNMGSGIDNMAKSFIGAIQQMAAQLAAKAAIFGILTLLTGGSGALAGWAGKRLGGKGFLNFLGFAEGGIVSGPTLANVGEYSGAKSNPEVVAPLSKLKGMLGGQTMNVKVTGKIAGKDIYLSGSRYAGVISNNT